MLGEKIIPLSVPNFSGRELDYVTAAIKSEWVSTAGTYITKFENEISQYVHCHEAVACQSGTAGLHIALLVVGVGKDDIVIVPALSFIATVNPVRYIGAEPIFMDCDDFFCMDINKLERFCKEECYVKDGKLYDNKSKKRIKAVIAAHIFGNMTDMKHLLKLARKYKFAVVEDAAEALGTYYNEGTYEGSFAGTLGDIGVYSFNGNKIITTGGGGMIVSNNLEYISHARHLTTQAKKENRYYEHDEIGYNYRMTNLQAALGLAQLEQLEAFIEVKEKNYHLYQEQIKNIEGIRLAPFSQHIRSNKWFYSLICENNKLSRDELLKYFNLKNIETRPIWGLLHEQVPYINMRSYYIVKAREYWKKVINIPCSTNLKESEVRYIIKTLKLIEQ